MTSSVVPKTHDRPRQLISPVLTVICLAAMLLLDRLCPLLYITRFPLNLAGLLPACAGLAVSFAAQRQFREAGTTLYPFDRPEKLVTDGLFRYTRNPMYLGLVLFLTGAWLLMGSLAPLGGVLAFVLIADRWYIVNEERRLAAVFGQAYRAYQAGTPRWI
jgi:protein-S-isoprenylcysteine O-methyltransferase Ste14